MLNFLPSRRRRLRRTAVRRGASVVEFAIVAPVFILLVFGMIEYGRMVMVQQILTNAAREGARVGVLDGGTNTQVETSVSAYLTNAGIRGASTSISPNPLASATYGTPVSVTVSVPFNSISWSPTPMYLGAKTLSASAVMRREAAQ